MKSDTAPLAQYAHAPLLILISAFMMMQPLSTDFYIASFPSLSAGFNVPPSTVQLTLSLFVLGFGGAQLIIGPLSDRFGRRPVLLYGLVLYLAASALCGLASTIEVLIAGRFLQALGCCSAIMVARAIVRDAYDPQQGVRVIAKASTWLSLAPIFGPILGSYLQVMFGWRAAFAVLGMVSACVLAAAFFKLPETNMHKNPQATAPRGLLAAYRIVLGSREFWAYTLPGALSYGSIFSFISGAPFVLIQVLNVPTAWFGFCYGFGVTGFLTGTIVCRRIQSRLGILRTFYIGTGLSLAGGVIYLTAVAAGVAHWALVTATMFLTMMAHGINFPIAQSGAVSPFPRHAGTAAGLMGAMYMTAAFAVGTIVGATHNGTLYPLAIIVCILGVLIFGSVRIFRVTPVKIA